MLTVLVLLVRKVLSLSAQVRPIRPGPQSHQDWLPLHHAGQGQGRCCATRDGFRPGHEAQPVRLLPQLRELCGLVREQQTQPDWTRKWTLPYLPGAGSWNLPLEGKGWGFRRVTAGGRQVTGVRKGLSFRGLGPSVGAPHSLRRVGWGSSGWVGAKVGHGCECPKQEQMPQGASDSGQEGLRRASSFMSVCIVCSPHPSIPLLPTCSLSSPLCPPQYTQGSLASFLLGLPRAEQ